MGIYKLTDYSSDTDYGCLTCDDIVTQEEVQDEINKIKEKWGDKHWLIEEVIDELPNEWNVEFCYFDDTLGI